MMAVPGQRSRIFRARVMPSVSGRPMSSSARPQGVVLQPGQRLPRPGGPVDRAHLRDAPAQRHQLLQRLPVVLHAQHIQHGPTSSILL